MFAKSVLAATLAGLAAAAPAARDNAHYQLQAIHSGDLAIHQQLINFANNTWVIGKDTVAPCEGADCSAYTTTVSVINAPGSQLSLYTGGTGFQYAYVGANSGTVGNTLAHSDGVYPNSVYTGPWLNENGNLEFEGQDFYACPFDASAEPDNTPYRIAAKGAFNGDAPSAGLKCKEIVIQLIPYTGEPAFQYD